MRGADASWESFQRSVKRSRVIEARDNRCHSNFSHHISAVDVSQCCCTVRLYSTVSVRFPVFFSDEMIFGKIYSLLLKLGLISTFHICTCISYAGTTDR